MSVGLFGKLVSTDGNILTASSKIWMKFDNLIGSLLFSWIKLNLQIKCRRIDNQGKSYCDQCDILGYDCDSRIKVILHMVKHHIDAVACSSIST